MMFITLDRDQFPQKICDTITIMQRDVIKNIVALEIDSVWSMSDQIELEKLGLPRPVYLS